MSPPSTSPTTTASSEEGPKRHKSSKLNWPAGSTTRSAKSNASRLSATRSPSPSRPKSLKQVNVIRRVSEFFFGAVATSGGAAAAAASSDARDDDRANEREEEEDVTSERSPEKSSSPSTSSRRSMMFSRKSPPVVLGDADVSLPASNLRLSTKRLGEVKNNNKGMTSSSGGGGRSMSMRRLTFSRNSRRHTSLDRTKRDGLVSPLPELQITPRQASSSIHSRSTGDDPTGADLGGTTRVSCGGATCKGFYHAENEDVLSIVSNLVVKNFTDNATLGLASVADGHAGTTCSRFVEQRLKTNVANSLSKWVTSTECWEDVSRAALEEAYAVTEKQFRAHASKSGDVSGACAVSCLVLGSNVTLAWLGDCACFLLDEKGRARRMTREHHADLDVERDRIASRGGEVIDGRLQGILEPTRSFGDLDIKDMNVGLSSEPETLAFRANAGCAVVLVSDGVTSHVGAREMERILNFAFAGGVVGVLKSTTTTGTRNNNNKRDPSVMAAKICEAAYERGSEDDITAVVLTFD